MLSLQFSMVYLNTLTSVLSGNFAEYDAASPKSIIVDMINTRTRCREQFQLWHVVQ